MMPSNHLNLCHPLLLLPSIFPSIGVFSNESVLHIRWPKYWSFSFCISSSNEYSGLISFRMDWFDLLAVQGTLKSLLQHHSSKAPIPLRTAFFIVQPSHPYMTTGKAIALTRWTFVGKVISLLSNMLSRLVVTFLPRNIDSNATFQIPKPKLSSWADFWSLVTVFGLEAVTNRSCWGGEHAEGKQEAWFQMSCKQEKGPLLMLLQTAFFFFFFLLKIYLAVPGLSSGIWDL